VRNRLIDVGRYSVVPDLGAARRIRAVRTKAAGNRSISLPAQEAQRRQEMADVRLNSKYVSACHSVDNWWADLACRWIDSP